MKVLSKHDQCEHSTSILNPRYSEELRTINFSQNSAEAAPLKGHASNAVKPKFAERFGVANTLKLSEAFVSQSNITAQLAQSQHVVKDNNQLKY
ncbi:hypothetical protein J6590_067438 [Homalodisca vitripennis]|nr:hypothetical protein J6590_067438 [Homalodisca vitripennis]